MNPVVETIPIEMQAGLGEAPPSRFDAMIRRALPDESTGDPIRIWVVGCGSIARVRGFLQILAAGSPAEWNLNSRVFVTDSEKSTLDAARRAFIHQEAEAGPRSEPSPGDLDAEFERALPHSLRMSVVLAEHDLLRAPPFARLDCIYCARPLAHFTAAEVALIFDVFHFALRSGGRLLLHLEESPPPEGVQFEPVPYDEDGDEDGDENERGRSLPGGSGLLGLGGLFRRRPHARDGMPPPVAPPGSDDARLLRGVALPVVARHAVLKDYGPPTVLVDFDGQIVHAREIPPRWNCAPIGESPALPRRLAAAIGKASAASRASGRTVVRTIVDPVDRRYRVRLRAKAVEPSVPGTELTVVFLETAERIPTGGAAKGAAGGKRNAGGTRRPGARGSEFDAGNVRVARSLEIYERLQAELRRATAELDAYQAEFQATYEELQTKNEELQIAEQALQARNDELTRINQQLRQNVVILERTHDDLTNLLRNTDQVMLVLDAGMTIQYFNRAASDLFGLSADAVGRRPADFAWKFDDPAFLAQCGEVIERLDTRRRETATVDGRIIQWKFSPYRARDRRVTGVVITGTDVTEERRSGLRQDLLATVLLDAPFAVIVFDSEGLIISWNEGAERIYGYSAGEILGTPIERFLTRVAGSAGPDGTVIKGVVPNGTVTNGTVTNGTVTNGSATTADALGTAAPREAEERDWLRRPRGRVAAFETVQQRSDGRRIVVSITASPIHNRAGEVAAHSVVVRDITIERELEQAALDAATAEQRRIGRELHDGIGQELTGLGIQAGTLVEALRDDRHPEAGIAESIYDAVRRTLGQVRALSTGLIPIEFEQGNLASALSALVERLPKPRGCLVRFYGDGGPPVENQAAAVQIYRIAQEAITNALKHSGARHIDVSLKTSRRRIVLQVADDGVGIDDARREEGVGIATMRYRADMIKAAFSLARGAERGTVVTCKLDHRQVAGGAA